MFDIEMYEAALRFCGLPLAYGRVFTQVDYEQDGKTKTRLDACSAEYASQHNQSCWVQVNEPREGTALSRNGQFKKAADEDIARIANVQLDFEYPQEPARAHTVGKKLSQWLAQQGYGMQEHPVEDSGAGCHIVLPIAPITPKTGQAAKRYSKAIARLVKTAIEPQFLTFCREEGIETDLEGYDISRILSLPGTWRKSTKANDCEVLRAGYMRHWLEPYIDGVCPERQESELLSETIENYLLVIEDEERKTPQKATTQPTSHNGTQKTSSSKTVAYAKNYASKHPTPCKEDGSPNRSAHFQQLVSAVWRKFGDAQGVYDAAETINGLAGCKYNGRLTENIEASLKVAQETSREPISFPTSHRPDAAAIIVNNTQLRESIDNVLTAISSQQKNAPTIFMRNDVLVRIGRDEQNRPVIRSVGVAELKVLMSQHADFYRQSARGDALSVSPPSEVAESILAMSADELPFPPLRNVVETPSIRKDGSILDKAGYDAATQLYYVPATGMTDCIVPDAPTQKDVAESLSLLQEMVSGFCYKSQADRANDLAGYVTLMLRTAIDGCIPLMLVDAPKQGSGKTLTADTKAIIATGQNAMAKSLPTDDDEMRKAITSTLLSGQTFALIDNATGKLDSPSLAKLLTGKGWDDRLLGHNQLVTLRNDTIWYVTGNNLRLSTDMAVRAYRVHLDPQTSRPAERSGFKVDLLGGWAITHRAEIIRAILTIIRAWYVAGCPEDSTVKPMRNFTEWAKKVGGILKFVGVKGFLANLDELHGEMDEESSEWEAFENAWFDALRDEWLSVGDVVAAMTLDGTYPVRLTELGDALPGELKRFADTIGERTKSFSTKLGIALAAKKDTCFGDENIHIESKKDPHRKSTVWRVALNPPVEPNGGFAGPCGTLEMDTSQSAHAFTPPVEPNYNTQSSTVAGPCGTSKAPYTVEKIFSSRGEDTRGQGEKYNSVGESRGYKVPQGPASAGQVCAETAPQAASLDLWQKTEVPQGPAKTATKPVEPLHGSVDYDTSGFPADALALWERFCSALHSAFYVTQGNILCKDEHGSIVYAEKKGLMKDIYDALQNGQCERMTWASTVASDLTKTAKGE